MRVYKYVVRSILTCMAETRAGTMRIQHILEIKLINIFEIVDKTKWNEVRNTDIRKERDIQRIGKWISRRRREWDDYISQMSPCWVVVYVLLEIESQMEYDRQEDLVDD